MANNSTGSGSNVSGSDNLRLEGPVMQNAWTHRIQRQLAQVDNVFPAGGSTGSGSAPADSDGSPGNRSVTPETDATNRGVAPNRLTETTLHAMNATQSSRTRGLVVRSGGRERSPTINSVDAQRGSPAREAADDDEAVTTGTSSRQSLQELALDFGVDARNILQGMYAGSSQNPRP